MTTMRCLCAVLLAMLIIFSDEATAQYWGERVMEKGFEQTDFHFAPVNLVPYGLGAFAGTTPGLLRDPLLDLVLNPAHLRLDSVGSDAMIYTDFRASRNVEKKDYYAIPTYSSLADVRSSSVYLPYPSRYLSTRKVLEPVFSGALILRPLGSINPDFLVGATYQMVLQDERYYEVPSDIYRNVLGADYTGRTAIEASSGLAITDQYSGEDKMHQNGHFVSLFVRDRILPSLEVGAKLGRVMHVRQGGYGSSNIWDSWYTPRSVSASSNFEKRDQGYNHWELNGGLLLHLSDQVTVGLTGGYLWGVGTQALTRDDTSYYTSTYPSNTSLYMNSSDKLMQWRHDGATTELGVEMRARLGSRGLITLYYRPRWSSVALSTSSFINDTSNSYYTWMNNTELVTSRSRSHLLDRRAGTGDDNSTSNLFLATVNWDIDKHVTLSLGAQLEMFSRDMTTNEAVEVHGLSEHSSTYSGNPYSNLYENSEVKNLQWSFAVKRTSFRIPVFVTIRASEVAGLLLGFSRDLSRWQIDDVTLAIFQRRYVNNNGQVTDNSNFGERYTQPQELTSDITTTFMAGLTIAPSSLFQARLLMVPVYADSYDGPELQQLQWWLGITVTP